MTLPPSIYNFFYIYRDQATFYQFVGGISANGGRDGPEDIMGGLKVALNNLSWRPAGSRVSSMLVSDPRPSLRKPCYIALCKIVHG